MRTVSIGVTRVGTIESVESTDAYAPARRLSQVDHVIHRGVTDYGLVPLGHVVAVIGVCQGGDRPAS